MPWQEREDKQKRRRRSNSHKRFAPLAHPLPGIWSIPPRAKLRAKFATIAWHKPAPTASNKTARIRRRRPSQKPKPPLAIVAEADEKTGADERERETTDVWNSESIFVC